MTGQSHIAITRIGQTLALTEVGSAIRGSRARHPPETLWEAKKRWPESDTALDGWYRVIKGATPHHFAEMQQLFPSVDKAGGCHVFDIGGNKLRLIAKVQYRTQKGFIRAVLDHPEYDQGAWKNDC